jgi:hypothetical protein
MLASFPASVVNQKHTDLGIPNRFNLTPSRFSQKQRPQRGGDIQLSLSGTGPTFSRGDVKFPPRALCSRLIQGPSMASDEEATPPRQHPFAHLRNMRGDHDPFEQFAAKALWYGPARFPLLHLQSCDFGRVVRLKVRPPQCRSQSADPINSVLGRSRRESPGPSTPRVPPGGPCVLPTRSCKVRKNRPVEKKRPQRAVNSR